VHPAKRLHASGVTKTKKPAKTTKAPAAKAAPKTAVKAAKKPGSVN